MNFKKMDMKVCIVIHFWIDLTDFFVFGLLIVEDFRPACRRHANVKCAYKAWIKGTRKLANTDNHNLCCIRFKYYTLCSFPPSYFYYWTLKIIIVYLIAQSLLSFSPCKSALIWLTAPQKQNSRWVHCVSEMTRFGLTPLNGITQSQE